VILEAESLFARHLDLTPLRHRRRGRVRCRFHDERTPSLSIDLDKGVFHCFGCGISGGVLKFAELVGERSLNLDTFPRSVNLQFYRPESVETVATRIALRQAWAAPGVLEMYRQSDRIRRNRQAADALRRLVEKGTKTPWAVLTVANDFDRDADRMEAAL
jgi:hypothetical protein